MDFRIRLALPDDAPRIAFVHVESWKTTYAGILPEAFLDTLDIETRTQRWLDLLTASASQIFVAEDDRGIFGFANGGPLREPFPPYDGELYAIYLLQARQGKGAGRLLVRSVASALDEQGFQSMLVWVLSANPAVGFYNHLEATRLTEKIIPIGGVELPESALGWPSLSALL